jgi:outer membrane protein OmpA-like peptidoglycan-associated protein
VTLKNRTFPFLLSTAVTTLAFAEGAASEPIAPAASASTTQSVSLTAGNVDTQPVPAAGESPSLLPEANLFEIGVFGGMFFPSSHHNLRNESSAQRAYGSVAPELGLRLAYFPLAFLGAELEAAAMPAKVKDGGGAGLWAARGHLVGQLTSWRITPFVLLGLGGLGAVSKEMGHDSDTAVHVGIGAKAALDEAISVRLDLRDTMSQYVGDTSAVAHFPEVLLGLSMTMDRTKPKPPPPPPPPDADKDGVPDASDACPTVAGVAPKGCPPDTDNDGVLDASDQCPTVVGPAPTGCPPPPDGDHDGVVDASDECPTVAGELQNGCPDLDPDKDGIAADKDKCPKEPETVNGYEDSDGCPDEVPEAVKRFTGVIEGIEFDFGKATIRPMSRPLLDKAVATLKEYPTINLKITGHTDNVGPRERNLDLSARRADEVKKYFVSKGIDDVRITTRGAGPDQPLSNENTAAARQKNRRIEFSIADK